MSDVNGSTFDLGVLQAAVTANGVGQVANIGSLKNVVFNVTGFAAGAKGTVNFEATDRDGNAFQSIMVLSLGKNPGTVTQGADTVQPVNATNQDGLYWFSSPGPCQRARARISDYQSGSGPITVSASGSA